MYPSYSVGPTVFRQHRYPSPVHI